METVLNALLSFLLLYKYVGLFCVAFFAALAFPLPAGSILAAAGAFAAQGYFDIRVVLVVALLGNVLADALSYVFTRQYGLHMLKKVGFEYALTTRLYKKLESHIWSFSPSLIFFSRFLTGVGPLVNVIAGLTKVRYAVFFGFGISGEVSYVLLYGLVGYFLGSEWKNNISFLFEATGVIAMLGVTIGIIQYGLWKKIKGKANT